MKSFASAAALAALASADASNHWAVIMAGSNTYSNYRHQADTHHAVQIMLANGIPRDHIIHLAYDDVANNWQNPFKGQLFNKPDPTGPGVNVYDQSQIDYSGDQVTKENFFKVLLGDTSAPGPVLQSNSESRVFINFADHGGAGLICTPQSRSKNWIYADELDSTLQQMKDKGMFKELVFYLEACESGSMFPNLDASENIFAVTASNATQSSYATYCGTSAKVNGKKIGSCLGDLFSVNWMEDTEANDISVETLQEQYDTVLKETTASPVQKFGNFDFMSEPIGDFEGPIDSVVKDTKHAAKKVIHEAVKLYEKYIHHHKKEHGEMVDSRDHKLHYLMQRVQMEGSEQAKIELEQEIDHRNFVDNLFGTHFPRDENSSDVPEDFDCLRQLLGQIEELCGDWSDYSLKYVRNVANTCDTKSEQEIGAIMGRVFAHCTTE